MKSLIPIALTLLLSPITSYAAVQFTNNTCNKLFKDEGNKVCKDAVKGDAKSRYAMARLFGDPQSGALVNLDYAFYWHLKLARQIVKEKLKEPAYVSTLYNTGVLYTDGLGTKQDIGKGFYWFKQAATLGDPLAMVRLAVAYENGIGTQKNDTESVKWLTKAVELNEPKAKIAMAKRLIEAKGVEKDISKAIQYLKDAASQNLPQASFVLGNAYLTGVVVDKDFTHAKEWYAKSCQLNMLIACKRYFDLDTNAQGLEAFLKTKPLK